MFISEFLPLFRKKSCHNFPISRKSYHFALAKIQQKSSRLTKYRPLKESFASSFPRLKCVRAFHLEPGHMNLLAALHKKLLRYKNIFNKIDPACKFNQFVDSSITKVSDFSFISNQSLLLIESNMMLILKGCYCDLRVSFQPYFPFVPSRTITPQPLKSSVETSVVNIWVKKYGCNPNSLSK